MQRGVGDGQMVCLDDFISKKEDVEIDHARLPLSRIRYPAQFIFDAFAVSSQLYRRGIGFNLDRPVDKIGMGCVIHREGFRFVPFGDLDNGYVGVFLQKINGAFAVFRFVAEIGTQTDKNGFDHKLLNFLNPFRRFY